MRIQVPDFYLPDADRCIYLAVNVVNIRVWNIAFERFLQNGNFMTHEILRGIKVFVSWYMDLSTSKQCQLIFFITLHSKQQKHSKSHWLMLCYMRKTTFKPCFFTSNTKGIAFFGPFLEVSRLIQLFVFFVKQKKQTDFSTHTYKAPVAAYKLSWKRPPDGAIVKRKKMAIFFYFFLFLSILANVCLVLSIFFLFLPISFILVWLPLVLSGFVFFYLVLTGLSDCIRFCPVFYCFVQFFPVLSDFVRFCLFLPSFDRFVWFYPVLSCFVRFCPVFYCFVHFFPVLSDFVWFCLFYPVLTGLSHFIQFCPVLSGFVRFCPVLSGFVRFCPVVSEIVRFCPKLSGFVRFYLVLSGFVRFCSVLFGFVRFCPVLPGFVRFNNFYSILVQF